MITNKLAAFFVTTMLVSITCLTTLSSPGDEGANAPTATPEQAKLSFWDVPDLQPAFVDPSPVQLDDDIDVGAIGTDGGNKRMITALAQEIADQAHGEFDSLLIAQHGKLLFESYYLKGRINLPHPQASTTKSYLSLAVGRAIQLGHLTMADLDKPVISFLEDLDSTTFVPGVEKITLHQAMTMRSGLRFSDAQKERFEEDSEEFRGQRQVQAYFEQSAPITSETQTFLYQGSDPPTGNAST